ncbi:FAD-dependent oxidoreductase [Erwinia sp. S38]|uniref:oxidoreductase n=1 Tax=Erwinia sp. S38 TaxID=2769338 RepID=UPI00190A77EA|nr:FAD-dependent oxidoreductase [Erwinia sp. S38]MBK0000790.1 FAD-dependent oxidoreductase [Erwinia sp. S38]
MSDIIVKTPVFEAVFQPLRVGHLLLRNRIINSGHGTSLGPGTHNEDLLAYEARRAEGGAAVVITQANAVSAGCGDFYVHDEARDGKYDRLASRIQAHGAYCFVQLNHPGRQAFLGPNRSDEILFSASAIPQREYGGAVRVPLALDEAQIEQIINDFAAAAEAVAQTKVDGIELHFGHGNLVQQFLSPETNVREDRWGGSAENRSRFALAILERIRARIGTRLVVGARVNLELAPQAEERAELTEQIVALGNSGLLDYLSVSGGNFSSGWGVATNLPDSSFPPALWQQAAATLKRQLPHLPIWLAGRVLNVALADRLITEGVCDAVTMARELVADPDLPRNAQQGASDRTRPCVGIQSGCWQRVADGKPIHCAFNPVAGREAEAARWQAPVNEKALKVVVVGAGPAGLEAARNAALQGHQVVLYDRASRPGGQLALIEQVPHRQDLRNIIDWYVRELTHSGAEFRLGDEVTLEKLHAAAADRVIIATGSQENAVGDGHAGFSGEILTVNQALQHAASVPGSVMVYDEWGGRAALSVAEFLAQQGHQIEFVTSLKWAGQGLNDTVRLPAVSRLAKLGVNFQAEHRVGLHQGYLQVQNQLSGAWNPLSDSFAMLVTSLIPAGNNALYLAAKQAGFSVQLVGDARAPRGLTEATREGYLAARSFGNVSLIPAL